MFKEIFMRLNNYISASGFCSRREADKLIKNKGLFERGIICYNNGDYNKALQYFQENIKNNSNDKAGYIYYCKTKEKLDMK